jgi:hypothetical protein
LLADSKIAQQIKNANHPKKPFILQIIETSANEIEYFGDAYIKEPISEKELIAQTKILTRLYNAENVMNISKHSSLQEIVQLIPTVFYIYNTKTHRNEVLTPHTALSLGYSPEEFEQYNVDFTERFMHPDDRKI